MKRPQGWGFLVALLVLWIIAVVYTAAAVTGMEEALHWTEETTSTVVRTS
jgi:hypothetical protein